MGRQLAYGSVCSGIEAATVAWHPLGWNPAWFAEIEKFPSEVLAHHYSHVQNYGDMTALAKKGALNGRDRAIDLLVGGTPCQAFSVAGLRKGLDDPRGNLTLTYLSIADRLGPRWLLWENVPGVLHHDRGRTFGTFLKGLEKLGYGWAYRVLDAQFVRVESHSRAVPQRRRRVFVVGYLGDWRPAAAVLFERESLRGHPAPSRKAGEKVAGTLGGSSQSGGFRTTDLDNSGAFIPEIAKNVTTKEGYRQDATVETLVANSLTTREGRKWEPSAETLLPVAHTLRAAGFDASEDGTGRGIPLVPMPFDTTQITHPENRSKPSPGDPCPTLSKEGHPPSIAYRTNAKGEAAAQPGIAAALTCGTDPTAQVLLQRVPLPLLEVTGRMSEGSRDLRAGLGVGKQGDPMFTLQATHQHGVAYPIQNPTMVNKGQNGLGIGGPSDPMYSLEAAREHGVAELLSLPATTWRVRRLTPRECERLQGFPDDYTLIPRAKGKLAADGPRYKALGNSMAVNVMRWIGNRIQAVDQILAELNPSSKNQE